ncbi:MAG: AAA family ATPase [Oscillospiraceae bacterium]|nr:AAA family ATPase [Oscillospiraceae bacterium]MBQ5749294.1 AAA family ATPase [Oscillospiraceae bacterium]
MKILSMTASFGKLENATLTPTEGLNIITLPNESGKSTWAAFLLAMLYGVDTSERSTAGKLAVKKKYEPWSGAPMQGRMEVEHNGRRITIERTSTGRVPMGVFRAFDSQSGLPIEGMTGENCGEMLLGAERSVFERSAFVAQSAHAVLSDAALEKRLAALVTTGEEDVSFGDTLRRIKDRKNHCRHNKTGLLPQLEAELAQIEDDLAQIRRQHKNDLQLRAEREELTERQAYLQTLAEAFEMQEVARQLQQKEREARNCADAQAALLEAKRQAERLPDEEVLRRMALELAEKEPVLEECSEPEAPACPQGFERVEEEEILPKAQQDVSEYALLTDEKRRPAALLWALFGIFVFATVGTVIANLVIFSAICGAFAVIFGVFAAIFTKKNADVAHDAKLAAQILARYAVNDADGILSVAAQYHEQMLIYGHGKKDYEQKLLQTESAHRQWTEKFARLLGQVSMFAPEAQTADEAVKAVEAALSKCEAVKQAQQAANGAQARFDAVCAALGDVSCVRVPTADVTGHDEAQVRRELSDVQARLGAVRSQLDLGRGRVDALGDPAELMAKKEALQSRIALGQAQFDALALAEKTLQDANAELQTRLSPQLCAEAGEILSRLTERKYDTVRLDHEMHAEAREHGGIADRNVLFLSGGTADQVYLAVRLAICRLALPEGTPLVLDDALVRFDDARMKAALDVLRQEAKTRQILLFSCQEREAAALG